MIPVNEAVPALNRPPPLPLLADAAGCRRCRRCRSATGAGTHGTAVAAGSAVPCSRRMPAAPPLPPTARLVVNVLAAGGLEGFCGLNVTVPPISLYMPAAVAFAAIAAPAADSAEAVAGGAPVPPAVLPPVPPWPPIPMPPVPPVPPDAAGSLIGREGHRDRADEGRATPVENAAALGRARLTAVAARAAGCVSLRRRPHRSGYRYRPGRRSPRHRRRRLPKPPIALLPENVLEVPVKEADPEVEQSAALTPARHATAPPAPPFAVPPNPTPPLSLPPVPPMASPPAPPAPPRPPKAPLLEIVVPEMVRVAPAALNMPPPRPSHPRRRRRRRRQPLNRRLSPLMLPDPERQAPRAAGSARATERLIGCDQALRDTERAGRVEDPASLAADPAVPAPPSDPTLTPLAPFAPLSTAGANGLVVLDRDRGEGHAASGVQDPGPFAGQTMLDRHARDRHLAAQNLDDSVDVVAVDDGVARSFTLEREIALDVEVAGGVVVLAGTRDRQRERAAGTMMVSAFGLALAAMIADRSEMCPEASLPVLRFTATVSSVVLTLNVESTTRSSSPSEPGRSSSPCRASSLFLGLDS